MNHKRPILMVDIDILFFKHCFLSFYVFLLFLVRQT